MKFKKTEKLPTNEVWRSILSKGFQMAFWKQEICKTFSLGNTGGMIQLRAMFIIITVFTKQVLKPFSCSSGYHHPNYTSHPNQTTLSFAVSIQY